MKERRAGERGGKGRYMGESKAKRKERERVCGYRRLTYTHILCLIFLEEGGMLATVVIFLPINSYPVLSYYRLVNL